MIILFVPLAAMAFFLMRGGDLTKLANVRVRHLELLCVPLVLQVISFSPLNTWLPIGVPYVYVGSMLIAAILVWQNRPLPGFVLLCAGLLSNLIAIVANGGYMPVSMSARTIAGLPTFVGVHNNVIEMTSATPLWFLGDLIPTPNWLPLANVFSVGDMLISLGIVVFMQRTLHAGHGALSDRIGSTSG